MLLSRFESIIKERERNYEKVEDGYVCKKCGSVIEAVITRVPLHDGYVFFKQCCGSGRMIRIEIPYCPKCEEPFRVDCLDVDRWRGEG